MPDPWYCVICTVLLGRRALPAITLIGGDAVCGDHVALRLNYQSIAAAIRVARADLELPDDRAAHIAFVEPLTDRETTVLHYLASKLTSTEIAREMYLSINTVKTYQRAIYRKLGASTRREAVQRARRLGLLTANHPPEEDQEAL